MDFGLDNRNLTELLNVDWIKEMGPNYETWTGLQHWNRIMKLGLGYRTWTELWKLVWNIELCNYGICASFRIETELWNLDLIIELGLIYGSWTRLQKWNGIMKFPVDYTPGTDLCNQD